MYMHVQMQKYQIWNHRLWTVTPPEQCKKTDMMHLFNYKGSFPFILLIMPNIKIFTHHEWKRIWTKAEQNQQNDMSDGSLRCTLNE